MSPFPHVRREQVPITDPRWLASTQPDREDAPCEADGCINLAPPWDPLCLDHRGPDPELEVDERRGLDGNGTMRASDLPASTWGAPQSPGWTDTLNMDAEPEVRKTKCLALSDDRVWPQQCWDKPGHVGPHDWERVPDSALTQTRREELRDTPSDVLPRRVPGEALRTAVDFQQAMDDFQMDPSAENLAATREVIERWPA